MDSTLNPPHSRLHALLWILCSTLLISGSALIAHTVYQTISEKRPHNNRYLLRALVQPQERLAAGQIAELLNLSADVPINLYTIDPREAENSLCASPLIRSAKVKRLPPDALYVEVTLRTPCALVEDHPGMALDEEGICFPYRETFVGPKVRIGNGEGTASAVQILQTTPHVSWVDASRYHHPRYGLREIVVGLDNGSILRLPTHGYEEALANYSKLEAGGPLIIDLRLPGLAYYSKH